MIAALLAIAVMAASLMISHAPAETPATVAVAADQDRRDQDRR